MYNISFSLQHMTVGLLIKSERAGKPCVNFYKKKAIIYSEVQSTCTSL